MAKNEVKFMNKTTAGNNKIETVFVLLMFCFFSVSVFLVLMLSGNAYQNMNEITGKGQNERAVLSYIRTKIRNHDHAGGISVGIFGESPALIIEENIDGRYFLTLIYYYDGWARELFFQAGLSLDPGAGTPLVRVGSLYFEELGSGLIRAATEFGSTLILPRSTAIISDV